MEVGAYIAHRIGDILLMPRVFDVRTGAGRCAVEERQEIKHGASLLQEARHILQTMAAQHTRKVPLVIRRGRDLDPPGKSMRVSGLASDHLVLIEAASLAVLWVRRLGRGAVRALDHVEVDVKHVEAGSGDAAKVERNAGADQKCDTASDLVVDTIEMIVAAAAFKVVERMVERVSWPKGHPQRRFEIMDKANVWRNGSSFK